MKRVSLLITSLLFVAPFAMADVCPDLAATIVSIQNETKRVLSQLTDLDQKAAVQASADYQIDQIKMQMAAAQCSPDLVPPDPAPEQPPTGGGNEPPVVEPPSGGGGQEPPVTEPPTGGGGQDPAGDPTVPGDTPGDVGGGDDPSAPPPSLSCLEQLDAYADMLRAEGTHQNDFVHKMMAKIHELGCAGNYGQWRSHCVKKQQKKACDDYKKKCEQKKKCDYKPVSHGTCKR